MEEEKEEKGEGGIPIGPPITSIVENGELFFSDGASMIKFTKGGKEILRPLPIRSIGIYELQEDLRKNQPRPPKKKVYIKAKSDEGKAAGLVHDAWVNMLDEANDEYQDRLERYRLDAQWKTVIQALNVEFQRQGGEVIESAEEKQKILEKSGITMFQLSQIFNDVTKLTSRREEEADFLSESELD